jgi:hypothetical protein
MRYGLSRGGLLMLLLDRPGMVLSCLTRKSKTGLGKLSLFCLRRIRMEWGQNPGKDVWWSENPAPRLGTLQVEKFAGGIRHSYKNVTAT